MHVRHLTDADYLRMPWRNGLGVTTEIARFPDAGEFDWRISAADVSSDGPFSKFEGYDRIILTLEGEGMILTHKESQARTEIGRYEAWAFSGDWATDCVLCNGPVRDFNVIFRRERYAASVEVVEVVEHTTVMHETDHTIIYCASGLVECDGFLMSDNETLVITDDERRTTPFDLDCRTGRATVIVMRLRSIHD